MTGSAGADRVPGGVAIGDELELDIGPVAHQGLCVARAAGMVVFVRYALPGERVVVHITEVKRKFCRGEAVRVLRADERRVTAPCAHFGPGGCGGCDWQHASADLQRELKAAVVREQLQHLAGIDMPLTVEALPGGGFGWRTRVRWAVGEETAGYDADRGPRRYRSHEVVPVTADRPCLIAADGINEHAAAFRPRAGAHEVTVTTAGAVVGRGETVVEYAAGRSFTVAADGFWQAHEHAARTLCEAAADALGGVDMTGVTAWDLYGGAGLFAAVLADLVGRNGRVVTVESDRAASGYAAANLADLPQVSSVRGRVDRVLAGKGPGAKQLAGPVNVVILDPPRSGAGVDVCRAIAARRPATVVYVACDPAALGRDTKALKDSGYRMTSLRAFDAFPQTHHVECVAVFSRGE